MAPTAGLTSLDPRMTRVLGIVRWFSPKGYGFIAGDDGQDVYIHHSSIVGSGFRTLPSGSRVQFRVVSTSRGPEAVDVVAAGDD